MTKNKKKILFVGGGSGGPVSPLLAIFDVLSRQEKYEFLWIGTYSGPEEKMVGETGMVFKKIHSGKLRRYFSWRNFIDPFFVFLGFVESFFIILKSKPDILISAGGFVAIPAAWAAKLSGIPILIHQQDVRPTLSNKLVAPLARRITVTFEKSLKDYGEKAVWTGNPVRAGFLENKEKFVFGRGEKPMILVTGGGGGALAINKLIEDSKEDLVKICDIVHITGKNKAKKKTSDPEGYFEFEFLEPVEMIKFLKKADLLVSRCGLGTLTEISKLKKTAILIPMPDTHQEENAEVFAQKEAAIVLDQRETDSEKFIFQIKKILENSSLAEKYAKNASSVIKPGAEKKISEIIENILDV